MSMSQKKVLWYDKPADIWEEALPIGNGRIGAMIFSGAISDKLQINEDTLWSGYPHKETRQHSFSELEEIRQLVKEKEYKEAHKATQDTMFGVRSEAYVPYGHLYIDILTENSNVEQYYRELNLEQGIVKSKYKLDGSYIEKEVFTSLKDDLLVVHIKSGECQNLHIYQAIDLENHISSANGIITAQGRCPTSISKDTNIVEYDETKESICFCSRISLITDGVQYFGGNGLWVKGACEVTVFFSIKTSFADWKWKDWCNGFFRSNQ